MLDSLVRVSRRAVWPPSARVRDGPRSPPRRARLHLPPSSRGANPRWLAPHAFKTPAGAFLLGRTVTAKHFPLDNFRHYFTLFPKFFSSFPHGTCSLSVSRQYLALEGVYLPIRIAFPNNPTLRKRPVMASTPPTGLSPSPEFLSRILGRGFDQGALL